MPDTLARLDEVFREVFEDDCLNVERDTSSADVEGWDSLMHISLILTVEKVFSVRFSISEVAAVKTVGELADLIDSRRSGANG